MGADIELGATTLSTPLECPHYGSMHTRLWKISDNLPALRKQNDKVYHSIWKASE